MVRLSKDPKDKLEHEHLAVKDFENEGSEKEENEDNSSSSSTDSEEERNVYNVVDVRTFYTWASTTFNI